jgi:hypothetical protein
MVVEHPVWSSWHKTLPENTDLRERERKSAKTDDETYSNFVKTRITRVVMVIPVSLEARDAKEAGSHPTVS